MYSFLIVNAQSSPEGFQSWATEVSQSFQVEFQLQGVFLMTLPTVNSEIPTSEIKWNAPTVPPQPNHKVPFLHFVVCMDYTNQKKHVD